MSRIYAHYRENAYHLYGDNTGKEFSYQELKNFFAIDGTTFIICTQNLSGDPAKQELYKFHRGQICSMYPTPSGTFVIR